MVGGCGWVGVGGCVRGCVVCGGVCCVWVGVWVSVVCGVRWCPFVCVISELCM